MTNTLLFLKRALQEVKQESKNNPTLIFAALVLVSIPLNYAYNSIALGLFALASLFQIKKKSFNFNSALLFPVLLFLLMALSIAWSINSGKSAGSLSKNLPLLIIPAAIFISPFSKTQINKIISYFSHAMVLYALFYLLNAVIRFAITKNSTVFFYHELVTKDVNAIHVSVYMAIAFFYFLGQKQNCIITAFCCSLLSLVILLLSSKNIIVVFLMLLIAYGLFFSALAKKTRYTGTIIFCVLAGCSIMLFPKIKERYVIEFETALRENTVNSQISTKEGKVYNVSIGEAWASGRFEQNDYFPGAAFRVYQARIFLEMLTQNPALFFTGYGLNATEVKIQQKAIKYNLYPAYGTYNFHNQYIQLFAELGIAGLLILLAMLGITIKYALKNKDFIHIAFGILMITLFLTESFLSRQRGIIFFTAFYCFFNAVNKAAIQKKKKI